MEKGWFSQQVVMIKYYLHFMQNIEHWSITSTKSHRKWILDVNVLLKSPKMSGENIVENIHDFEMCKSFLDIKPKVK